MPVQVHAMAGDMLHQRSASETHLNSSESSSVAEILFKKCLEVFVILLFSTTRKMSGVSACRPVPLTYFFDLLTSCLGPVVLIA